MADFSPSGIYGLPPVTADTLKNGGDPRVLGWLQEAVQEGDFINRDDPAFDSADKGMRYIIGEQRDRAQPTLQYIPYTTINKSRKATQAHVSALTDLKPVFSFKASNSQFQFHADLLNRLAVDWWLRAMADMTLGDCIKYALAGGTADLSIEWDPGAAYGLGDHRIVAKDFRDTLPVRPGTDPSPQLWQGVVFREAHSINTMRAKYPGLSHVFQPATDNLLTTVMSRFRRVTARLQTPMGGDTLSGLASVPQTRPVRPGDVVLYRACLTDATKNLTGRPLTMGDPISNWSYVVEPYAPLYPQKRLIVATAQYVLYDGPGVYWHSMFPFARLKLWSVPWCFLGLGLLHDTMPVQDAINDSMKDLRLGLKQWVEPDTEFDKRSTSRAFQTAFDPRRPGKKIAIDQMSGGNRESYKKHDGPSPQALALLMQNFEKLEAIHDDLTGVANLQQLMQLRQMPGADTIQKYYEAMTPELRQEGRQVEAFLRDMAQMYKFNIFQFETANRRRMLLGDAALALEDFDFDPESLVPAMDKLITQADPMTGMPVQVPNPQYIAELDANKPRGDRAKAFARMFMFTVAPNSILAINAQEKKMMNFQLARMGYLDFWTLHETLETPNVGNPPPIPLPALQPPPPEIMVSLLQTGVDPTGQYLVDPMRPGVFMQLRTPMTITERLIAQQMMGIGMTENPAGRKASGQEAPQIEDKGDRTTVTESPS